MKVIKQNKLLASIITSDILYFTNTNNSKKKSNFFSNKIEVKNKAQYVLLDIIPLLQSIKQIIRLLQYNLKHYKNFLQIITSSNLYNQIIEHTSKAYGTSSSAINASFSLNTKLHSKIALYLGNDVTQNLNHLMSKTFNNNINSIILINSYFSKNILGNYKIYNNIDNYKKLLFLVMIILLSQKNTDQKLISNKLNYKKK